VLGLDLGQRLPAAGLRVYVEHADPAEPAGTHADVRRWVPLPPVHYDLGITARVLETVGG
jgi:hypothetical protein